MSESTTEARPLTEIPMPELLDLWAKSQYGSGERAGLTAELCKRNSPAVSPPWAKSEDDPYRVVSTSALLRAVRILLNRYITFTSEAQATAVALWVLHTHAFDAAECTPYLGITSATKRSGKSRILELLELLVARAWMVTAPSEATLFRKVHADRPTILLDEIDATFGKDSTLTEGIRGILNAGYRHGAWVPRVTGVNSANMSVTEFEVFCPKAFAGIGDLPDTIRDRSIPIVMRRRAPTERTPQRFRLREVRVEVANIRAALESWGTAHTGDLATARPVLPDELSDRGQDVWEPLLAIADLAGRNWSRRTRAAAVELMGDVEDGDLGVLMLRHIGEAFADHNMVERVSTKDLLTHLVERGDDSPWARQWSKALANGELKSPSSGLARILRPFGIQPTKMRVAGDQTRGYRLSDLEPIWERYGVGPSLNPFQNGTLEQSRSEAISGNFGSKPENRV